MYWLICPALTIRHSFVKAFNVRVPTGGVTPCVLTFPPRVNETRNNTQEFEERIGQVPEGAAVEIDVGLAVSCGGARPT